MTSNQQTVKIDQSGKVLWRGIGEEGKSLKELPGRIAYNTSMKLDNKAACPST
jgi:hypothetical protein